MLVYADLNTKVQVVQYKIKNKKLACDLFIFQYYLQFDEKSRRFSDTLPSLPTDTLWIPP